MEFETACNNGDLNTIKSLIGTVDINQKLPSTNFHGTYKTYLDTAVSNGYEDVVEYFCSLPRIQYGNGHKPTIYRAVNNGNVKTARMIKERFPVDFTITKGNGECLLGLAVRSNSLDMVKFLVEECHMDVNHRNVHGFTPLYIACNEHHVDTDIPAYLLSRSDIVVEQNNMNKLSLLHLSCLSAKFDLFKLLYPLIDANLKDKHGKTALDYAKERSCIEIFDYVKSLS